MLIQDYDTGTTSGAGDKYEVLTISIRSKPQRWIITIPSFDQWLPTIENHWIQLYRDKNHWPFYRAQKLTIVLVLSLGTGSITHEKTIIWFWWFWKALLSYLDLKVVMHLSWHDHSSSPPIKGLLFLFLQFDSAHCMAVYPTRSWDYQKVKFNQI